MRVWRRRLICLLAGLSVPTFAQHGIQQKRVSRVSLQIRPVKENRKSTCLSWFPLRNSEAEARYVELNPRGKESISVRFSALFNSKPEECNLVFDNESIKKIGERVHSSGKIIHDYVLAFEAPASVVRATSGGLEEDLVFDAPIEAESDRGFFEFFSRSAIYFENRYTILSTDNPKSSITSVSIFPVFGGKISTPLPYLTGFYGGYSLFQNLGSIVPSQGADVAYSEFMFDLTYQKVLSRLRTQVGFGVEVRGRNVYQVTDTRPFVVGQVLRPGLAAKLIWFPSFYSPTSKSKFRFGVDTEYHFLNLTDVGGSSIRQQVFEVTLQYRLSRRGSMVLGLGYSKFLQSTFIEEIVAERRITENTQNFFLRLSLFPVGEKEPR